MRCRRPFIPKRAHRVDAFVAGNRCSSRPAIPSERVQAITLLWLEPAKRGPGHVVKLPLSTTPRYTAQREFWCC